MVEISSLIPSSLWISIQNLDVNFESLSDTIISGNPCNLTIWVMNNDASSDARVVVLMDIKYTIDVNRQIITHK